MKFTINKNDLLDGLLKVQNIVNTKLSISTMNNVLLNLDKNNQEISLTTSNLDIMIKCIIDSNVLEDGSICINIHKLCSIIKSFDKNVIIIFQLIENKFLEISYKNSIFQIPYTTIENFPQFPLITNKKLLFNFDQKHFLNMIKKVEHAQLKDDNNNILGGILFQINVKNLTMVASDGRRLSIISSNHTFNDQKTFILSTKTIKEIKKLLLYKDSLFQIDFFENKIYFNIDIPKNNIKTIHFLSCIIHGTYPNYNSIIPNIDSLFNIQINRKNFLCILERSFLISKYENIPIKISFTNDSLKISSISNSEGKYEETMNVIYINNKNINNINIILYFNPLFLIQTLKILNDDNIYCLFQNNQTPLIIKNESSFMELIMPVKL